MVVKVAGVSLIVAILWFTARPTLAQAHSQTDCPAWMNADHRDKAGNFVDVVASKDVQSWITTHGEYVILTYKNIGADESAKVEVTYRPAGGLEHTRNLKLLNENK